MATAFAVFLLTAFPLRILFPVALILSAYLKPRRRDGDRVQTFQFWLGIAGGIGLAALSLPGTADRPLSGIVTLLVVLGGVLAGLAQAATGRRSCALTDLGLLFLVCLIGYPFFAATLE